MEQKILELKELKSDIENDDKKHDAQRAMAWFALFGMLLYPSLIVICSFIKLDTAATILGDIASVYFVAIAGLVAAFFGASAWVTKR